MSWQELESPANTITQRDQPLPLTVGRLGFHIFTGRLMVAWIALVACTLFILEQAVQIAKESISIPWRYSTGGLPALMVTVVAQGHVTITTMYLTRLALSGLHVPFGTPKSWAEMFWLAGAKWSGPVGMIEAVFAAISLRIWRVSKAFLLFCIISITAFALPVVLESAYTVTTVEVALNETCMPYTLAQSALSQVISYKQMATGGGAWATGQSVISLYNESAYHRRGQNRGDPNRGDFFFSGDVQGSDMTLPGVRVHSECRNRVDIDPSSLFPTSGEFSKFEEKYHIFHEFCRKELEVQQVYPGNISVSKPQPTLQIFWCSSTNIFDSNRHQNLTNPGTRTLFWFNTTDTNPYYKRSSGFADCAVTMQSGIAQLNGRDMSYNSFMEDDSILKDEHGDEPLFDPISAVVNTIRLHAQQDLSPFSGAILGGQLGYKEKKSSEALREPPTAEKFTERLQDGVLHMTASLMVLSRTNDTTYDCTTYHAISAFTRNNAMVIAAIVLLSVWLAGILLATAIMLRPTFSDGLDSHAAARLLLHRPDLMKGIPFGPHDKNKRLAEVFSGIQLDRIDGRDASIEMDEGVGNYAETHAVET